MLYIGLISTRILYRYDHYKINWDKNVVKSVTYFLLGYPLISYTCISYSNLYSFILLLTYCILFFMTDSSNFLL